MPCSATTPNCIFTIDETTPQPAVPSTLRVGAANIGSGSRLLPEPMLAAPASTFTQKAIKVFERVPAASGPSKRPSTSVLGYQLPTTPCVFWTFVARLVELGTPKYGFFVLFKVKVVKSIGIASPCLTGKTWGVQICNISLASNV